MGSMSPISDLSAVSAPPFKVLVVGGSYGGLSLALNLQDLCSGQLPRCGSPPSEGETPPSSLPIAVEVTIVDERDGFYHVIGSPLALADETFAAKAWVKYTDVAALHSSNSNTIRHLHGSVQSIDMEKKVASFVGHRGDMETTEVTYDYLVAASGLRRVWPVVPQSSRRKQYLFEVEEHIAATKTGRHGVVVVGGGAVGIEMAAELKLVQPQLKVTMVHSRDKLLSSEPLPDDVKDRALELLREADVEVLMSTRLDKTEEVNDEEGKPCTRVTFTNGRTILADQVIMAVSRSIPSTTYLPEAVLNEEGYVRIHANLAMPSDVSHTSDHFAIGDIAQWSGIKRCGAAMHMGYLAAHNIHQLMRQRLWNIEPEFSKLDEVPPMIGLAVGKKAVAYWPEGGVTSGEDVLKNFFGNDLGFSICWNYLRLGGEKPAA